MILLKNIAVGGLLKKACAGIREAISSENLSFNRFQQLRNFYVCSVKHHSTQWEKCIEKDAERLCTRSKEPFPNAVEEDLFVDEEEEEDYEDDHYEEGLTPEIFEEVAGGDPEVMKKLKLLELEVAIMREEESRVPDRLSKNNWRELLELPTMCKRKKFLSFLRLNELKRMSSMRKFEVKREMVQKYKEERGFHYYGLSGHTMFMRVYDRDINKLLISRLWHSSLNIVLDCSYQEYMSHLNLKACAKQIFYTFSEARLHRTPCQLQLCNFNKEDALGQILPKFVPGVYENFYGDIHSESYLDLYPKDKLVYLTPHAKTNLLKFNHDDIYIIGAFVDKGTGEKASLAKAKEQNLRMVKFPLDEYLIWKRGPKSLPLNTVLTILLDMAFYNDWRRAFKSIPARCLNEN